MQALSLIAIVAAALWLRLGIAWDDLETVLLRATSDDAYYYLQIARTWVGGGPPSLDGEVPTNGFHPLWLGLCALAWKATGEPVRALQAALTLGAAFGTATTVLTWAILRRLGVPASAALLAAALYGLHPYFATEATNGLETSVAVFTIALLTWLFVRTQQGRSTLPVRDGVALGAAAGLMLLARTDSVFIWACMGAFLAARAGRHGGWAGVASAAGVSLGVIAPWLIWSATSLGGALQVSGYALSEPPRLEYLARHGDSLAVVLDRSFFLLRDAFLHKLPASYFVPAGSPVWPAWLLFGGLALALLFALDEPERGDARRRLTLLAVPGMGIVTALAWHAGVRWWLREWYFAPAGWLGVVFLGLALGTGRELLEHVPAAYRRVAIGSATGTVALLLALLVAPGDGTRWGTVTPHRVTQFEGARWIDENLAPDARIGAFNAGILSYFSDRTVVNLDGAVNAEAYRARRDGRMMDYIVARQLDYLVDWRGYLAMAGCTGSPAAHCSSMRVLGLPHEGFGPGPLLLVRVERGRPR